MKILLILLLIIPLSVQAKKLHKEKYYQDIICKKENGTQNVRMSDGTWADCVNDTDAIEVDFQKKLYECHSQAVLYAQLTKKKPVCYLIINARSEAYIKRYRIIDGYFHHKVELRFIDEQF